MSKVFKVGDKVICVKNTPDVQEGWVGYVEKVFFKKDAPVDLTVRQEYSLTTYDFRPDELEVLKADSKRVRFPEAFEEKSDAVHNPKHYAVFDDIEAIEVIARSMTQEMFKGYCFGNLLKYRLRVGGKDEVMQELSKADKYKELYEKFKGLCQ